MSLVEPFEQVQTGHVLTIEPIRSIEGLDEILSLAARMAGRTMLLVLEEFRPEEKERFTEKVMGEWREQREIPEIEVRTHLTGIV